MLGSAAVYGILTIDSYYVVYVSKENHVMLTGLIHTIRNAHVSPCLFMVTCNIQVELKQILILGEYSLRIWYSDSKIGT